MKTTHIIRLSFLMILAAMSCLGQDLADSIPVVEMSKLTGGPTKLLPFDREFYLKVPKTKEFELHQVHIHKLKKNPIKDFKTKVNGKKTFAYRKAKKDFWPVEKRRIELTYGSDNYDVLSRKFGSGKALTVSLDFAVGEGDELLSAQQITQRKSNVVEKEKYVLVKVFPLLVGQYYAFSYTLKSKNGQIEKLIDKTIEGYAAQPKGDPNQLRIPFPEDDTLLLSASAKTIDDYLELGNARTALSGDFEKGIKEYNAIAEKLMQADCLGLDLTVDKKNITDGQYRQFKSNWLALEDKTAEKEKMMERQKELNSVLKGTEIDSAKYKAAQEEWDTLQKAIWDMDKEIEVLEKLLDTKEMMQSYKVYSKIQEIENEASNDSHIPCVVQTLLRNGKTKDAMDILFGYDAKAGAASKGLAQDATDAKADKAKIDDAPTKEDGTLLSDFLECYEAYYLKAAECDTCYSTLKVRNENCADSCELTVRKSAVNNTDSILLGNLPIHYRDASESVGKTKYALRKQNLLSTARFIEQVGMINYRETITKCTGYSGLLKVIYDRIAAITAYEEAKAKLLKDVYGYEINGFAVMSVYTAANIMGASSGATTLKTKSKFTVRPDFGVAYFTNFRYGNEQRGLHHGVLPFFGVRFNLTPIDPDIAFRRLRYKTFWHRSSISIAYSPITLADGKTRSDLYDGMNFLLGYGFRFSNAINLTAGAVMYKREHPDPFITKQQLAVAPYLALSVDFDVVDAIKHIKELFIK